MFLDAPLELPPRPGDSLGMRCWWRHGSSTFEGWDTTLASLERAWDERGPFAGVIGFSQGAAVAFLLALLAETADRDAIARGVATDEPEPREPGEPTPGSDASLEDSDVENARFRKFRKFASLDFFILCSGYVPAPSPVRNPHGIQPCAGARIGEGTSPRACLVLAGEKDEAVPARESLRAGAWFRHAETNVRPDGKHEVSTRACDVDAAVAFVARHVPLASHSDVLGICGDDENAYVYSEEVWEEIEAMRSIFDEDMRDVNVREGPLAFAFSARSGAAEEIFGRELCSNPAFVLELPVGYPETQTPRLRLKRGLIGMAPRLAVAFREGLARAVAAATRDALGTPSLFVAVSEARDWLEEAMRAHALLGAGLEDIAERVLKTEEEATAAFVPFVSLPSGERFVSDGLDRLGDASDDDDAGAANAHRWWEAEEPEEDDAAVSAAIAEASAEAARAALADAERRRGGIADPEASGESRASVVPAKEKGGRWDYVIGLVGKPSAGKSTFYNSAAALAYSDANAAKVAPYPFTTIEPNVANAFAALPCACASRGWAETCRPANGHTRLDGAHKRLGKVRIKDVAGLVPGAHRGRGRGNAFLNDLCDADVLVHVVDASGRSDRDGVDRAGGDEVEECSSDAFFSTRAGALADEPLSANDRKNQPGDISDTSAFDPAGDVRWVRDEIHRWIFANVRAKWRGVRRRPERLRELFSGYHCPPTVADAALRKCGVADPRAPPRELIRGWAARDLHVLVAHFTRARFPTLLALNKCDVASSKAHARRAREAWPLETCVDVSARDDPTSVRRAVAAAVALKPPTLGFPVACLDAGTAFAASPELEGAGAGFLEKKKAALRECVLLKPGSTVEDLFAEARRMGACGNGELVRSETSDGAGRRRTLRRDEPVAAIPGGVVKFYVNRKVKWQGKR